MKKGRNNNDQLKFRAVVDDNTALTLYQRDGGLYLVIKKDLGDYDISVQASEAPVMNQFLRDPDSFERIYADRDIIEKELTPINVAVSSIFGESKEISIRAIRLVIGSGMDDYITVDETDLFKQGVEPTISGIIDFVQNNNSVIGIADRIFEHEKGNIKLLVADIYGPVRGIIDINFTIMMNLQQRGLFLRKKQTYGGLQLYITVKSEVINQDLVEFLKMIGIDWESIYIRREFGIDDWVKHECERNSISLKGYLKYKYRLEYFDINNIVYVAVENQLDFKIVTFMAELLESKKLNDFETRGIDKQELDKAEIIAAARLACEYYNVDKNIVLNEGVRIEEVLQYEEELIRL